MSNPQPPILQVLFKRYAFGISHFVKNSEGLRIFVRGSWLFFNLIGLICWLPTPNSTHSLTIQWHTWVQHNLTLHLFLIAMFIVNIFVFLLGWIDLIYRLWTSSTLQAKALNDTLNFLSPSFTLSAPVRAPSSISAFNARIKLLKSLMFIGILGTFAFFILSMFLLGFTVIMVALSKMLLMIPQVLHATLKKCLTLRQHIQEKNQKFLDEHPEETAKMLAKQLKETLPESNHLSSKARL